MRGESKPKTCNCICNLPVPRTSFMPFRFHFCALKTALRVEKNSFIQFFSRCFAPTLNNFEIEFLNAINLCRQNVCGELLNSSASTAHRAYYFLIRHFTARSKQDFKVLYSLQVSQKLQNISLLVELIRSLVLLRCCINRQQVCKGLFGMKVISLKINCKNIYFLIKTEGYFL